MSGIEEITKRISVANAESKRLNNERQVNIGKKETLTQQLNEAIKKYNEIYGTSITVDTVDKEVERVSAIKEKEVSVVENILTLIQNGQYEEAKKAAGVVEAPKEEENKQVEAVTAPTPVVETLAQPEPVKEVETVKVEEPKQVGAVTAPAAEAVVTPPVAPSPTATTNKATLGVPSMVEGEASTEASLKKPNLSGIDALDGFTQGTGAVAPPPVVAPQPEKVDNGDVVAPPPSFDSILNGTAFKL